jgi:transglutaminase-like putative cysteine protease
MTVVDALPDERAPVTDDVDARSPLIVPAAAPTPATAPVKSFTSDLLATVGLAAFSFAVAAGFARVFAGWNFFDNLAVLVIVGHGAGLAARRLRLANWLAIPIVAFALVWTIGVMFYASTYSWGLPSGDTWALFTAEIDLAREQFHVAVAPVPDLGGWPVLAAIGVAFAVCLSDAFAFGALARAEALVPGGVLFVFISALGDDRLRVELTVVLVGAGVAATVLLRAHHAPGGIRTSGAAAQRVVCQAVATGLVIALLAGWVGQRLPGARAEALFDTRGGGDGSGSELSPLVDIRSRLTNQSSEELIVVTSNVESYWRSTTLPAFDGSTWEPADRAVAPTDTDLVGSRPPERSVRQQVRIVGLGGTMIPVAPDPTAATGPETIRYDRGTSTLTAAEDFQTGDSFVVVSATPRFDPETLAAATSTDAGDPIYLELPADFPGVAAQTALEVTAGATSSYEAALALQNWFKSEFTYSLEVQPGHGNTAMEGFLRDRVGYCEQFAGTYAAMMRSLGIPARVAVGFTSGQAIGGDSFTVAGRNAHAWPEVWFDGIGWVLFEPTPGRGAPGTQNYTGVAPAQDTTTGQTPAEEEPEEPVDDAAVAPTTVAPVDADSARPLREEDVVPTLTDVEADSSPSRWTMAPWILLAVALLVAAPAVVRRIRRRAVGRTNDEKLRMMWERSLAALREVGVSTESSQTPAEIAHHAARAFPVASRPMKSLAEVLTEATYCPEGSAGFDVAGAYGASKLRDGAHWTRQVERAVNESVGPAARVRRYFTRWG